jgi:tellurite methyltransferase
MGPVGMETVSSDTFWQRYYVGAIKGDCGLVDQPSPFAEWVHSQLEAQQVCTRESLTMLEVGCGNGRDSAFFAARGIQVIATDKCEEAVKLTASKLPRSSIAQIGDVSHLPDTKVDYAYARFVLHAITEDEQIALFKWIHDNVRRSFFVETRSVRDPRFGRGTCVGVNAYVDTHYRRFMTMETLNRAVCAARLRLAYCVEQSSASGNDGAMVLRAEIACDGEP